MGNKMCQHNQASEWGELGMMGRMLQDPACPHQACLILILDRQQKKYSIKDVLTWRRNLCFLLDSFLLAEPGDTFWHTEEMPLLK